MFVYVQRPQVLYKIPYIWGLQRPLTAIGALQSSPICVGKRAKMCVCMNVCTKPPLCRSFRKSCKAPGAL